MGPTLTALLFAGLGSGVAHAEGMVDFSGATTLMSTFKTFAASSAALIKERIYDRPAVAIQPRKEKAA